MYIANINYSVITASTFILSFPGGGALREIWFHFLQTRKGLIRHVFSHSYSEICKEVSALAILLSKRCGESIATVWCLHHPQGEEWIGEISTKQALLFLSLSANPRLQFHQLQSQMKIVRSLLLVVLLLPQETRWWRKRRRWHHVLISRQLQFPFPNPVPMATPPSLSAAIYSLFQLVDIKV